MPDNIEEQRSTIIPETIELSSSEVAEPFHRAHIIAKETTKRKSLAGAGGLGSHIRL